jgi:hypothetical protein
MGVLRHDYIGKKLKLVLFSRGCNRFNQPVPCSITIQERKLSVARKGKEVDVARFVEVSYRFSVCHHFVSLPVFFTNSFLRCHGQACLVRASAGFIPLCSRTNTVCPCHPLPEFCPDSFPRCHGQASLVRGSSSSFPSNLRTNYVCPCHLILRATINGDFTISSVEIPPCT